MKDSKPKRADFKSQIKDFPSSPGIYIMKNKSKEIIYVGKARNLKNRVGSYFNSGKDIKTSFLVSQIYTIEYTVTENEYEALLLENNLIKQWKPRFNIDLKDGKSYPVIRITGHEYPRVFRTRSIVEDGSSYFGPFPDVKSIDRYMELIDKLFPLRKCKGTLKKREAPCLYYHIKRCPAPCVDYISLEEYKSRVRKVRSLLSGKTVMLEKELKKEMGDASAELNFEKAAEIRDVLLAIEKLNMEQRIVDFDERSRDYIGTAYSGNDYSFAVMQMRGGRLLGRDIFRSSYAGDPEDALTEFVLQYYGTGRKELPETLFLSHTDVPLLKDFFRIEKGRDNLIRPAEDKRDQSVMKMAEDNALIDLDKLMMEKGNIPALEELQLLLNLPVLPRRIEGFDIAQLNGQFTVASLVSFKDGNPDKKNYRRLKMKSLDGKIDDYKSIAEAVSRRYTRVINEDLERPDLILIDGGKGQVNAAHSVLKALNLDIPLAGLAKKEELIFMPGFDKPVDLPEGNPALRVLQYVRDETHRFATGYNKTLRKSRLTLSSLESVPGIGQKRSTKLLKAYGSLQGIYEQKSEDIASTAGVSQDVAETLKSYLSEKLKPSS
ncbi:excinuclease ABC subunit UvrC [Spirochaeta isovalerica]|uniref:UvrABC system protein C n=1 Tax=Spirochaeta isovalerica TaxID=150 RepID=A0A841RFZ7_9SPIO|nr:excinuclease ABC subunit UvrC [Spirochaeta isovalerica]MBB6482311.1 excinuclease ABC subunit C [Spirochaeta isovalerica]